MNKYNIIKYINLIYFLFILLIGLYFGKERAIFCDGSNALYDIIADNKLYYANGRFGTIINYILPWIANQFHASLKTIVYLLSINYLILPIITFLFLRYKQKDIKYEIAFLIGFSIINWQTFFYPIHDYWTGFYLFYLLYPVIDKKNTKTSSYIIVLVLIIIIVLCHLNTLVALFFGIIFLYLNQNINKKSLVFYMCFITIGFLTKQYFFADGYETDFLQISQFSKEHLWLYLSSDFFRTLPQTFISTNINFTILFIATIAVLLFKKKYKLLVFVTGSFILTILLLSFLFRDYPYTVYLEGQLKSTTMFFGIVFSCILFSTVNNTNISLLIGNCIFSVFLLINGGNIFKNHYNYVNETCKKFTTNTYLYTSKDICPLEFIVLPRHSIIINQLENNKNNFLIANNINKKYKFIDIYFEQLKEKNKSSVFKFDDNIQYINADSMQIDIAQLNLVFKGNCEGHLNRIIKME